MSAEAPAGLVRRRFTVAEYERMGQTGILGEDDRVELLGGEIVQMTPIGPLHASVVDRLNRLLVRRLDDRAVVRVRNPLRLGSHSEPQPDVAVVGPRDDSYRLAHPGPPDVLLVVEVADTSAAVERAVKLPLYASAGIVEVWLIDLATHEVVVHRDPHAGAYTRVCSARSDESLSPAALTDVSLPVAAILAG